MRCDRRIEDAGTYAETGGICGNECQRKSIGLGTGRSAGRVTASYGGVTVDRGGVGAGGGVLAALTNEKQRCLDYIYIYIYIYLYIYTCIDLCIHSYALTAYTYT